MNPTKILDEIGIQEGEVIADFGAGSGFYTIAAAKRVGPNGKVYAIDILQPVLDIIASNARLYGLSNVVAVRGDLEKPLGSNLENASCDDVIIANVLFQSAHKEGFLKEAARVLKPGGRLALIEWFPDKLPSSGSLHPLSLDEARRAGEREGFGVVKEFVVDLMHYGILFKKA